jgi:hypothetical protein
MIVQRVILSGFCVSKNCIEGCGLGFDTILPLVESLSLTTVKYFTNE